MLIVIREKACSQIIWCGMLWRSCTRQDSTGLECSLYVNRVKLGEKRGGGRRLGMGARAQNQQHTRITFYSESWCVTLSCEDIYAVVKWDGMKRQQSRFTGQTKYIWVNMYCHSLVFKSYLLFWDQVGKTPSKQVCLIWYRAANLAGLQTFNHSHMIRSLHVKKHLSFGYKRQRNCIVVFCNK